LSARYEGERYVDIENTKETKLDGHFSLDLSLTGTIVRYVSWTLSVENMLNKKYEVYSVPTEMSEAPGVLINGYLTFAI